MLQRSIAADHCLDRLFHDSQSELARIAIALVQKYRTNERFKSVGPIGFSLDAAGLRFPLAQYQVSAHFQNVCNLGQGFFGHQSGPHLGELALRPFWKSGVKFVSDHQSNQRVPQKLQAFIGLRINLRELRKKGAMHKGKLQQRLVIK